MNYQEFKPAEALSGFVKCYYLYETTGTFEDKAFATGCVELMFNIGEAKSQTLVDNSFVTAPPVELWGQIIKPLSFKLQGKNRMFGIRFFSHAASCFLNEDMTQLNNRVSNGADVAGKDMLELHARLCDSESMQEKIEIVNRLLLSKLKRFKHPDKISLISSAMTEMKNGSFHDTIENVALRHGISSRYLQKLFLQHTGITPKLFIKINRFQKSLKLISGQNSSLTDIAYACGYFDQAHFIRDYKSFTGYTPSSFSFENSTALLPSSNG